MEIIDDREYLEPPAEEEAVLKCYYCGKEIYEGEEYYKIDDIECCEECIEYNYKKVAEKPGEDWWI